VAQRLLHAIDHVQVLDARVEVGAALRARCGLGTDWWRRVRVEAGQQRLQTVKAGVKPGFHFRRRGGGRVRAGRHFDGRQRKQRRVESERSEGSVRERAISKQ
jgi:hypothetical protein